MGATIITNDIADNLDPAFSLIHDMAADNTVMKYEQIYNILNSTRKSEKHSSVTDMISLQVKPEGIGMTYAAFMQKYDKTYTHVNYALATRITEEAYDDDLSTGKLQRIPKCHVESAANCVETITADEFDTALSTNGPDGVPLFSASHPTPLSATLFANTPSTACALTIGALENSILRQEQTLTDSGNPMFLTVANLLVQTANLINAKKILQSANTPFEQSNTRNVLQEYNINLIVWKYITSTTFWATLVDKTKLQFYFYWRKRLTKNMKPAPDNTDDAVWTVKERFSAGYDDWRGVDGSLV